METLTMPSQPPIEAPRLDSKVLDELNDYVATKSFLFKLEQARSEWLNQSQCSSEAGAGADAASTLEEPPPESGTSDGALPTLKQFPQQQQRWMGWWLSAPRMVGRAAPAAPRPAAASAPESAAALQFDQGFVVLNREDAIEAMAYYIAVVLSREPEAQKMTPQQLQRALTDGFRALQRSRFQQVWQWGRALHRWGAIGYSALQLYEHPWLMRAMVTAIWASSRMALGWVW